MKNNTVKELYSRPECLVVQLKLEGAVLTLSPPRNYEAGGYDPLNP